MLETLEQVTVIESINATEKCGNTPRSLTKFSGLEKNMAEEILPQFTTGADYSPESENVSDRDNQQERPVAITRFAMAIECEGHITIGVNPAGQTRYYISMYPTIGFTNTDPILVHEMASFLDANEVGFSLHPSKSRGAGKKMRFDISVHGQTRLGRLIELLEPHIVTKKAQLDIVKRFNESRASHPRARYSEYEWNLCKQVRLLNRRMPGKKAFEKSKALLESPESIRQPIRRQYLEAYVKMCSELQRELESAVETAVPPILSKWVKKQQKSRTPTIAPASISGRATSLSQTHGTTSG